jgi:hypothetical protein
LQANPEVDLVKMIKHFDMKDNGQVSMIDIQRVFENLGFNESTYGVGSISLANLIKVIDLKTKR